MSLVYLGILCFLLLLAVFDLSVGVANDAVNFMSPAVGAKAARFRTILIIAAIGIFVGASTSSGMMDIARHGILQPSYYSFNDVMCVFLAVSATDVILMDIFNTLGMPTSTTVSMVFGLLGGSTALAISKILTQGYSYGELIHTEKALSVILGIFMSVAIAFVTGFIIMWIVRSIFTFEYKKHLRWSIAIFGGISITSIAYFLLVSGLKGSRLLGAIGIDANWISDNSLLILFTLFIGFTILVEILHLFLKVNIFKVIVLFGTFSLAMAFAGNDLVNFIGVPLAGLESFVDFTKSGATDAHTYTMTVLDGPSKLPGGSLFYLIGAGIIMIIAIFTSKKSHQVVKTSVNLASQNESEEVFSSSRIARKIVRSVLNTTNTIGRFVPEAIKTWINGRFNTDNIILGDGAAFDMVRASVNLVLAGLLIVIGTTLRLPLSTTYVAFMVAMGSSLADRAWGRETAVYRITGVITVIGGWFITAGAAFILSMTIATLNHLGGIFSMIFVIGVVAFVIWNNNRRFKRKQDNEKVDTLFRQMAASRDKQQTWELLLQHVTRTQVQLLDFTKETFSDITKGLMDDNIHQLREAGYRINNEKDMLKRYRRKEIVGMRKIDYLQAVEKNTWFYLGVTNSSQIIYCLRRMIEPISEHVDNNFSPLPKNYQEDLKPLCRQVELYLSDASEMIRTGNFTNSDQLLVNGNALKSQISEMRHRQQNIIQREDSNIKIALLYLNTLQETQELISMTRHLLRAAKRFQE